MGFYEFLSPFDLFKRPLYLRVNKKEMATTKFGIFLSMIVYGFLLYFFSQSDCFLKLSPKLIQDSSSLLESPNITYINRSFAFSLRDSIGNSYYDPNIFYFQVQNRIVKSDENGIISDANNRSFHACNKTDAINTEDLAMINNSFCLDENYFSVAGGISENIGQTFQIHLYLCKNSTENNNSCKSIEEMKAFFTMKNLNLIYTNTFIQPKNYNSPMKTKLTSRLYKLDGNLNKLINIAFQKVSLINDENYYFSFQNSYDNFQFEKENIEIGSFTSLDAPFTSIVFTSSNSYYTIIRSYQSLFEAIAAVGGLLSSLLLIGRIICHTDKLIFMTTILMNFLYIFQQNPIMDKEENEKNILTNEKTKQKITLLDKIESNEEKQNDKNKNEIIKTTKNNRFEQKKSRKHSGRKFLELSPPITLNDKTGNPKINFIKIGEKILNEDNSFLLNEDLHSERSKHSHTKSDPIIGITKVKVEKSPDVDAKQRKAQIKKPTNKELESFNSFIQESESKFQLNFSFFDFFRLLLKKICRMKKNFKEQLFSQAQQTFDKEVDLVSILQNLQDIEKLKYLLLSEKQKVLFDSLQKPMIFIEDNERINTNLNLLSPQRKKEKNYMEKAYQYYKELQKQKNPSELDSKLYNMIHFKSSFLYMQLNFEKN